MATVDATTAGTAHGTLTPNTAEVINFGYTARGQVEVLNRGTTVMYGQYGVTDLTIAGQGTEAIPAGESVVFYGESNVAGTICLKSTAAVDYSVSKFDLPREGGGGSGGGGSSDTELPGAAALSDTTANPTAPMVGAALMYWDGAQWVRWQRSVAGAVASGSADSGNPVKIGGKYNATLPALSDGNRGDVQLDANGRVRVATRCTSAATANVAGSATNVTLQAANASRLGLVIYNDSTAALYVKLGATASSTSFTYKLAGGQTLELPPTVYTGIVDAIWDSATGSARVTELS